MSKNNEEKAEGCTVEELKNKNNVQVSDIKPSKNHFVLYYIPFDERSRRPPVPHDCYQKWDSDHVRLPCSLENKNKSKNKWELIEESLLQPFQSSHELEQAIKKYNQRYKDKWNFIALHELFKDQTEPKTIEFFSDVLPAIIAIALQLPSLIPGNIPFLKKNINKSISMSQQQAACLLANAFLCTFPMRNDDRNQTNLPNINFNRLYGINDKPTLEKLKCIINYFTRVLCSKRSIDPMMNNVITFQRHHIRKEDYSWEKNDLMFSKIRYRVSSEGTIEDADGMLQVDFANRLIGGGVLGHGCVQEEIRFVINPEMIVARLFTEELDSDEALVMIGCEQFSQYRGYSSNFEFVGDFEDKTSFDHYRRRLRKVVAIDALPYHNYHEQFEEKMLIRELIKATAGFSTIPISDYLPVATGLWGCGAFNGHIIKSALVQFMACAMTERNINMLTFGDEKAKKEIAGIFEFLVKKEWTIMKLYNRLVEFGKLDECDPDLLIPFIMKKSKDEKRGPKTLSGILDDDSGSSNSRESSVSKANKKAMVTHL